MRSCGSGWRATGRRASVRVRLVSCPVPRDRLGMEPEPAGGRKQRPRRRRGGGEARRGWPWRAEQGEHCRSRQQEQQAGRWHHFFQWQTPRAAIFSRRTRFGPSSRARRPAPGRCVYPERVWARPRAGRWSVAWLVAGCSRQFAGQTRQHKAFVRGMRMRGSAAVVAPGNYCAHSLCAGRAERALQVEDVVGVETSTVAETSGMLFGLAGGAVGG